MLSFEPGQLHNLSAERNAVAVRAVAGAVAGACWQWPELLELSNCWEWADLQNASLVMCMDPSPIEWR